MKPDRARELVRRHGLVPLTRIANAPVPSLVDAIAGEPVVGSWWSHPKGKAIFAASEALADAPDVLVMKLLASKVTFVDASLWPALYRIVGDPGWRRAALRGAGAPARRLAAHVDEVGQARLDELAGRGLGDARALSKAKADLEKRLVVHATQMHTERGAHATVLEAWEHWASDALKRDSGSRTLADAQAEMARHAPAALLGSLLGGVD